MHRSRAIGLLVVAVVAIVALVAAARSGSTGIRFTDGTPDDLRTVATQAWDRFARAFAGRSDCLGTVTVGVAWELSDRARYVPAAGLVRIRAPGTAGNLEASMLHEFAHHADHRCGTDAPFRRDFLVAAGLAPVTPWSGGEEWHRIPSERFAEAAVVLVLGEPPPHVLIHVGDDEVAAVAAWAGRG